MFNGVNFSATADTPSLDEVSRIMKEQQAKMDRLFATMKKTAAELHCPRCGVSAEAKGPWTIEVCHPLYESIKDACGSAGPAGLPADAIISGVRLESVDCVDRARRLHAETLGPTWRMLDGLRP